MGIRPTTMLEFIGQSQIRPVVQNAIDQAKAGKRLVPPTLLFGGPGLGKSALASVIAHDTDTRLMMYTGGKDWTGVRVRKELLNLDVRGYGPGGVWQPGATKYTCFFDEVHALNVNAYEAFFWPLETLEVHDGETFWLPDIQFVFATTDPSLPKPFLDRIPLQLHLEPYCHEDLCRIVTRIHPHMAKGIVAEVARRSCGVARLAINYSTAVDEYPGGLEWFDIMGIDSSGLTEGHRKYISVLEGAEGRPLSLPTLSSIMRENVPTIRLLEEELLRQGRINITVHGRSLMTASRGAKLHK